MPSFIIYSLGYQWAWTYSISYLHSNIGYTSYHDHYIMSSYFYEWNIKYLLYNEDHITYNYFTLLLNNNVINTNANTSSIITFDNSILPSAIIYQLLSLNAYYIEQLVIKIEQLIINEYNNENTILLQGLLKWNEHWPSHSFSYLFEVNTYLVIPLWSCIKIYCFSFDVIHSLSFYSFGFKLDAIPGRLNLTSSLRSLVKGINRGFCYELCGEQHNTMLNTWIIM
jgi:heme/copper-type cytochrome/quinol oxidase subunit 2